MIAFLRLSCAGGLFALTVALSVLAGSSDSQMAAADEPEVVVVDADQLPTKLREQLVAHLPEAGAATSFVLYAPGAADKEGKSKAGKDEKGKGDKGKGKDEKGKDEKGKDEKGKGGKTATGTTVVEIDVSKLPPELTAQLLRYALSQHVAMKKDDGGKKGKDEKGKDTKGKHG
jgi:hypothetical protein